jgi:D-alanyl-D-alanine dipeptidase
LPAYGEVYTFAFDAYREGEGYVYYGPMSQPITLTREELLGTELSLGASDNGNNTYTLTWNETKGDYYEFQHRSGEKQKWNTLLKVEAQGERTYTTGALKPYSYGEYRVVALNNDGETVTESDTVPVQMGAAVAYSTIWPIKDLEVYTDSLKTQSIGTAPKAKAFCVLKVEGDMFRIRFNNDYGYIDSNYCLINLPECMGDLCSYDITNSYASLFKIHEYPIPELTDTIIPGYENVMIGEAEDEDKQFLVPLLYPVVDRLAKAAQAADKAGYTLKIVDAYRPRKATQVMYDTVVDYAENNMVPTETPPAEGGTATPTDPTISTEPTTPPVTTEPVKPMTFAQFMSNNGKYKMNYFVAKGTSRHNRGAALDLTLENAEGEVLMQTAIHDLSWFSETAQNNDGAKVLAKIMKGAGFGGLVSEWWHFQDDEVLDMLDPPALDAGVSPECWMADGIGWRYRKADGYYVKNTTKTIDGMKYQFDKQGYAIQQEG